MFADFSEVSRYCSPQTCPLTHFTRDRLLPEHLPNRLMPRDVQRPWSPGSGDIVGTIRVHMARVTSLCNVLHSSSLCRPPHSDFSRDRRRSPLHGQVNNVQREVARKRRLADHEEPQTAVPGIVFLLTDDP